MQDKLHRICPCCGKPLELIPPSKALLPNRVGVSSNLIEYYLPSNKRYFSITSKPHSHYKQNSANALEYRGNLNKHFTLFDKSGWHIVPVNNASYKIEKDGLWIYSYELVFFCKNCMRKLSLNRNPLAMFSSVIGIFFVTGMSALFAILLISPKDILSTLRILMAIFLFILLETSLDLLITVRMFSNFVPTDEFDNLIYPHTNIVLSNDIKSVYLREGNVFQSKMDGEDFYIYLIHKNTFLAFSVCGIEGEQERLLTLIHEKQERGEKVSLPLTFEGKFVGNAEVLETYILQQSSAKER